MTRPETTEDDRIIATRDSLIAGTVFVWQYDRREDRHPTARIRNCRWLV